MPAEYSAEDYYREQLRLLIWSGFFNEGDFRQYLEDLEYDAEAHPYSAMLAEFGQAEIAEKQAAETTWPAMTDCDRLDSVFHQMDGQGILALANAGYTTSDAHGDAWGIINEAPPGHYRGFCFYHGQDVERAVLGHSLWLGFDAVSEEPAAKRALGEEIAGNLRQAAFYVVWNGDPETRMSIEGLDWKRRTPWEGSPDESESDGPTKRGWLSRLFGT